VVMGDLVIEVDVAVVGGGPGGCSRESEKSG
jgi:ribulose 1,5-bisphosphate synthetase/thiazole synthase